MGHGVAQDDFLELCNAATDGVTVERNRPVFDELLARCSLSISQAGYNTVMDILQSGVRAVLVPYAEADEQEQTIRAELLAARGRVVMLPESELTTDGLAAAADAAIDMPLPQHHYSFSGAARSAELVLAWLDGAG